MTLPALGQEDRVGDRHTTLFQLLSNILAPYDQDGSDQWQLNGRDVEVSREKITNLAFLFHEFATNAAKYGALSVEDGNLSITMRSKTRPPTSSGLRAIPLQKTELSATRRVSEPGLSR